MNIIELRCNICKEKVGELNVLKDMFMFSEGQYTNFGKHNISICCKECLLKDYEPEITMRKYDEKGIMTKGYYKYYKWRSFIYRSDSCIPKESSYEDMTKEEIEKFKE